MDEFEVKIGVYKRSVLSPLFFAEELREEESRDRFDRRVGELVKSDEPDLWEKEKQEVSGRHVVMEPGGKECNKEEDRSVQDLERGS